MRKIPFILLLLTFALLLFPSPAPAAQIGVGVSIIIAPPILPVYAQPICPGDGYIWTPGYWAYGDDGYYWVPGTWILAPEPGFLWTPGYWGWGDGVYLWHGGYWGPHIGFYGGVNYGFGYGGVGYDGGYWRGGHFFYNSTVNHIDIANIHNVYTKTVIVHNSSHVSFNGGNGGLNARPTASEEAAARDHHVEATSEQTQHEHLASTNRDLRASANHGHPAIAATSKPGEFSGKGVEAARGGNMSHGSNARPEGHAEGNMSHESTPPKSESHSEMKPQRENAPKEESRPKTESAPHAQPQHESAPKSESKPKTQSKPASHPSDEKPKPR